MRPRVWIIILFTFIETLCFGKAQDAQVFRASACFDSHTCPFYRMNCSAGGVIQVKQMQYGLRGSREQICRNTDGCESGEPFCCSDLPGDCLKDFREEDALNVTENCPGIPFCGPFRATRARIDTPNNCTGEFSQYVVIKYTCLQGTDTTVQLTSTTNCLSPSVNKSSSSGTGTTVQLTSTTNGLSSSGNKSSSSGPSTTTPRPETTASNIMTSTSTLSTRVSSSDNQTSPGLTSTSLNGTSTTAWQTGTSATTSNTIPTSDKYSSTAVTSASFNGTEMDGEKDPERLIIIVVVVVAALVLSAILVIVFILHRRRCKKSSQADAPKNQLPDVLINHSNLNFGGTDQDYKAAESSNYDEMNDESIATYSRPVKKKKDGSTIAIDEKKTGGYCATDEYDRIEFAKKYPVKMPNYDSVSVIEVKKVDDMYSHVSSQWKPASAAATNDYSHCQFIRHESKSNEYTNKTAVSNEPLIADNYSHVDLNAGKTKIRPSNIIEEDSYNPNELDKTTYPPRNGHAVSVRTIAKSEEGSQTFKDLQSLGAESEGWPICDRNSGVSSQDQPLQDIKAISLPDKYIEFKIGDIYDTPRCKDQQYNVVLKGNKEQLLNRIETGSKRKSETEDSNGVIEDCAVRSDYELAKPIDF